MSIRCKIVITVKLSQFDNASNWSEILFVKINKLWICRKYFCIFLQPWLTRHSNDFIVLVLLFIFIAKSSITERSAFYFHSDKLKAYLYFFAKVLVGMKAREFRRQSSSPDRKIACLAVNAKFEDITKLNKIKWSFPLVKLKMNICRVNDDIITLSL